MKKNTQEKASLQAKLFFEDLTKSLSKIGEKHGYSIPDFNAHENEGALFINIAAYTKDPDSFYRKWYLEISDNFHLKKEWLNQSFFNPEKNTILTLIGADPNGGDFFIRARDQNGKDFHLSPLHLKQLINENSHG